MNDETSTIAELSNRRQFFRVEDEAYVSVAPLRDAQAAADAFDLGPEFGLISEFQMLDIESKHLLHGITDKDKQLGQLLGVMNKKLDSLARVVGFSQQSHDADSLHKIDLSEGGINCPHHEKLEKGQRVAVKLVLLPNYSGLIETGHVMSCNGDKQPFDLHIAFDDISEAHQQLLARHIMRKQSQGRHTPSS